MFLRALNSIILQSPHVVKPGDIADLLAYTKTVVITIDAHHFGEEEYLFPALAAYTKNQDIMSANRAQHAAFHAGLSRLGEYCKSTSPDEYSHTTFKGLIDAFAPSLYEHLRDEIPTILALKVYPSDELRRMWVQAEKQHIADVGSYDEMLPLAFGCMDRGFEGGRHKFPPAPWWVAWVVRYWFARRHQSVWRFNPCDMWGGAAAANVPACANIEKIASRSTRHMSTVDFGPRPTYSTY
ncbi:hemerythrin HHE cation binding domain-containing protein [Metarhizium guizhouense ARSEF 977]|uniref:Hemerythrin HHE cation binding domain-containing protein n=1 Tax=Metarhizium guizhouense (strain ARSEF 977) TaxID=1276136 RepID=A0A0B4GXS0_METGA|nr:hemerythrin HHE cation binding domain-containing protein [Metarhizium guizhouense ARSEF 977]